VASEAKPFASLSSGLLARKGAARPAMKPQGFGQMGGGNLEDLGWNDMGFEPPKPAEVARDSEHDAFGEDIVEHPKAHPTGLTPIGSPVHDQQAEIAGRLSGEPEDENEVDETAEVYEPAIEESAVEGTAVEEPVAVAPAYVVPAVPKVAPRRSPRPRSAPGSKGKAAFTLRLDPSRHLKLRLACAVNGRSAQQLVTDALDRLLGDMPELEGMAEKAKRKG
jgi:hypothetical protein